MKMYFIPEAEIRSYNVSQKINQNIKLVRKLNGFPRFDERLENRHFMLLNSDLILYAEDNQKRKRLKIWKLDQSGLIQFLTNKKIPLRCVRKLIFDSMPIFDFVTRESKSKAEQLKFSFREIAGINSQTVEIDDVTLYIDGKESQKVLCSSSFVAGINDNLLNPNHYDFRDVTIWNVNKEKENCHCLFILFEIQLKEANKYKLGEISRSNLDTCTSDLFVVEKLIFDEVEETIIIQVGADSKIILFLFNTKLKNIEETTTAFESQPSLEFDARSTKTFFVNNLDFGGGGGIVAVSCIVKQIKAYSRSGRTEFRLRFCQIQVSTMYVV